MISLSGCGTDADTSADGENNNSQQDGKATYKVGDEITVSTDEGEYTVKFTGIKETKERNEFWDEEEGAPDRVILISYEVANISYEDDLYVSEMNMSCYDAKGTKLETYPADVKYADSISTGRNTSGEAAFALNNEENHVELEYYDNMFNSKPDFMIVFEW